MRRGIVSKRDSETVMPIGIIWMTHLFTSHPFYSNKIYGYPKGSTSRNRGGGNSSDSSAIKHWARDLSPDPPCFLICPLLCISFGSQMTVGDRNLRKSKKCRVLVMPTVSHGSWLKSHSQLRSTPTDSGTFRHFSLLILAEAETQRETVSSSSMSQLPSMMRSLFSWLTLISSL